MKTRFGILVLAVGALAACAPRAPEPAPVADSAADDSIVPAIWRERTSGAVRTEPCLGPGDLLQISVFRWSDLQNYRTRVSASGDITLPLLGAMHVAGLSETDVRDRIADALKRNVMRDPQVSVFVAEYVSQQVSVTGAVARPGLIGLTRDHRTVSDLISEAGGLDEQAGGRILLYPAHGGSCERARPLLQQATTVQPIAIDANADYGQVNPLLLPVVAGDAIVVNAGRFTVHGWVTKPGVYDIAPGMTALGGVSAAGGANFAADLSRVEVYRAQPGGTKKEMQVDMDEVQRGQGHDIALQAGDVIHVPASPIRIVPYSAYWVLTNVVSMGAYVPLF